MSKVFLGDVAKERKETCKGSKNGYPIVGLEHLTPEEITLSAWDEDKENSFTKLFHEGDVLFGRRRAYLKKAAVAPFDGICSGDITVIEAIPEKILPELMPFIIQNDALFDFAVGKSAGSLSPRVKWEHLKNYEFELPNMEKQRELAKVLWAMDATKNSYQKLLQKTDELVESQFVEMFGDPNSENTEKVRFSDYATIIGGFAFKSKQFVADMIPIIRISNIEQGSVNLDYSVCYPQCFYDDNEQYRVRKNDILMAMSGATTGKAGLYRISDAALINQRVACIRNIPGKSAIGFLYALTQMDWFYRKIQENSQGGAQPNISLKQIGEIKIPVAKYDMQNQFAAFVQQTDKTKFELEQALAELTATYKNIISENLG
jgi:type I restriction enzyme, S subunit